MHKTEIRIQWFDVDCAGVVYFGNYFRFFTIAEDEFLRSLGITHNDLKDQFNIGFSRVEATCKFIRSAHYNDLIEIHTRMKLEDDRFLTWEYNVFRISDQTLVAQGMVRTACISFGEDKFKLVRMPEEVFKRLNKVVNKDLQETTIE